jgi:hypothetical protein
MKTWGSVKYKKTEAQAHVPKRSTRDVSGEYRLLYRYLEDRYASTVVLTFSQIEDLLGFALPAVARTDTTWWTSADKNAGGSPHSYAWLLASRTATPNLMAHIVTFERQPEPSR